MSLIGVDGSAYTFNHSGSSQSSMSMMDSAPITTHNSFQFDGADSMDQSGGTAASSSNTFSSQPVSLFSPSAAPPPLQFAPSNPQRLPGQKSSSSNVKLDFSEFEDELASMEEAKRKEFLEQLELNARKIAEEKCGTAALPSQIGDSKLFHSMVLKQYGKIHHLELDAKKVFQTRKAKQRDARRAKKAEDKADQQEAKSGGAMRKNKHKNRSKGVY